MRISFPLLPMLNFLTVYFVYRIVDKPRGGRLRFYLSMGLSSLFGLVRALPQYLGLYNGQLFYLSIWSFAICLALLSLCTSAPKCQLLYLTVLYNVFTGLVRLAIGKLSLALFGVDYMIYGPILRYLGALSLYTGLIFLAYFRCRRILRILAMQQKRLKDTLFAIMPMMPFLFLRDYVRVLGMEPAALDGLIFFLYILCGICALFGVIAGGFSSYQAYKGELEAMELLLEKQEEQFNLRQRAISQVNREYHDLRHMLRSIEAMEDMGEVKRFAREIEGRLRDYALLIHTGNSTMDLLFSDYMRLARERGIDLHIMARGQGWERLSRRDIAALFGNAMDNALECAEQLPKPGDRRIEVRVDQRNGFLAASFENPYIHPLVPSGSLFTTTKADREAHGYGLQSIRDTAERWGGSAHIETTGNIFALTILIPL